MPTCNGSQDTGQLVNTTSGLLYLDNLTQWDRMILENKIRPLSPAGYTGIAVYLVVIGMIAAIGNILMLIVFCRNRKLLRQPHNQLLLNLVVSDIGISVFGYPLTTSSSFAGRYLYGDVGCILQGFLTFTFAQTDMNTLACLSLYRYVAVCMPGDFPRLTTSVTKRVIAFLWIYTLLWTVPPLIGWSAYTYEPFGTSCSIDWDDSETGAIAYTWCLIIYCYLIHIIIMVFCYYHIAVKAREVRVRLKQFIIGGIRSKDCACFRQVHSEKKATTMGLALTLTFIILWSPYAFVCLWSVYDPSLPIWLTTWPTMFAKFTCTLNPILYFLTNPSLRRGARAIFKQNGETETVAFELHPLSATLNRVHKSPDHVNSDPASFFQLDENQRILEAGHVVESVKKRTRHHRP